MMKDILRCLCRLCARKDEFCVDLFEVDEDRKLILKKIRLCLPVIVQKDDGFPRKICFNCVNKLDIAYELYYSSLTAQTTIKRLLESEPSCERDVQREIQRKIQRKVVKRVDQRKVQRELERDVELVEEDEPVTTSLEQYLKRKSDSSDTAKRRKLNRRDEVSKFECITLKTEPTESKSGNTNPETQDSNSSSADDSTPSNTSTNKIQNGYSGKPHISNLRIKPSSDLKPNNAADSASFDCSVLNFTTQCVTAPSSTLTTCVTTSSQSNVIFSQAPSLPSSTSLSLPHYIIRISGSSAGRQNVPREVPQLIIVPDAATFSIGGGGTVSVFSKSWPVAPIFATGVAASNSLNLSQEHPTHILHQATHIRIPIPILVPQQIIGPAPELPLSNAAPETSLPGQSVTTSVSASAPTTSISYSDSSVNSQTNVSTSATSSGTVLYAGKTPPSVQAQNSNLLDHIPNSLANYVPSLKKTSTRRIAPKPCVSKINTGIVSNQSNIAPIGRREISQATTSMSSNSATPVRLQTSSNQNATELSTDTEVLPTQTAVIKTSCLENSFNPSTSRYSASGNTVDRPGLPGGSNEHMSTNQNCRISEAPASSALQSDLPFTSAIHILKPSNNDNTFSVKPSSSSNVDSTLRQVFGETDTLDISNMLPIPTSEKNNPNTHSLESSNVPGTCFKLAERPKPYYNKKQKKEKAIERKKTPHITTPPQPKLLPPPPAAPLNISSSVGNHSPLRRKTVESDTQTDFDELGSVPRNNQHAASNIMHSQSMTPVLNREANKNICCPQSQANQDNCLRNEQHMDSDQVNSQSTSDLNRRVNENQLYPELCRKCHNNLSFHLDIKPQLPEISEADSKPNIHSPCKPKTEPTRKSTTLPVKTSPPPPEVKIKCPHCLVEFPPDLLLHHKSLHYKEKFFTCLDCNKNFVTELGLEAHRCQP